MPRAVLDTNVLVSGVIASGYSAEILAAARRETLQLVTTISCLPAPSTARPIKSPPATLICWI